MTDKPIDFTAIRAERESKANAPDSDQVSIVVRDGKPEKWFKFSVDFKCDGSTFSFHIWALDFDDATRRVQAIRETATLFGQVMSEIPV